MKLKLAALLLTPTLLTGCVEDEVTQASTETSRAHFLSEYHEATGKFSEDIVELAESCKEQRCAVFLNTSKEPKHVYNYGTILGNYDSDYYAPSELFLGKEVESLHFNTAKDLTNELARENLSLLYENETTRKPYQYAPSLSLVGTDSSHTSGHTGTIFSGNELGERVSDLTPTDLVSPESEYNSALITDVEGVILGVYFEEISDNNESAVLANLKVHRTEQ